MTANTSNPAELISPEREAMFQRIQDLLAMANGLSQKLNELKGETLSLLDAIDFSCARSGALQIQRYLGRVAERAIEKLADEIASGQLDRVASREAERLAT